MRVALCVVVPALLVATIAYSPVICLVTPVMLSVATSFSLVILILKVGLISVLFKNQVTSGSGLPITLVTRVTFFFVSIIWKKCYLRLVFGSYTFIKFSITETLMNFGTLAFVFISIKLKLMTLTVSWKTSTNSGALFSGFSGDFSFGFSGDFSLGFSGDFSFGSSGSGSTFSSGFGSSFGGLFFGAAAIIAI